MQVEHDGGLLLVDYSVMADARVRCAENCSDLDDTLRIGPMEAAAHFMSDSIRLGIVGTPDWKDLPSEVHVKILRDAVLVHDQVYTPTYEHSEPWGEGCGEGIQASYVVTLPR